jgi:spermidine/putrescine transport system substrate-binding protein
MRIQREHCWLVLLVLAALWIGGCSSRSQAPLLLHDFVGDVPDAVLASFTEETGIPVTRIPYESTEEAFANLQAGKQYDLVVMENRYVPALVEAGLLAPLDYQQIPNFKNISLNFRDLIYDPGNRYSVPYTWGTTGVLVRTDLVKQPVTRWADLWQPELAGKVAIWRGQPREFIALTLKSLGYSANDESPAALAEVRTRLLELRPNILFTEDYDQVSATPVLASGQALVAMGYSADALLGRAADAPIAYVLPAEGAVLWGDNYVIPAASTNRAAAMQLLNYLLRPEVAAEIMTIGYFTSANEAARQIVDPALANDPVLYPPQEVMQATEILLPLTPDGERRYAELWDEFVKAHD